MKKVILLSSILCFALICNSNASSYSLDYHARITTSNKKRGFKADKFYRDGGAINNFTRKTTVHKKNKNIKSPIVKMHTGSRKNIRAKKSTAESPIIEGRKYTGFDSAVSTNIYADQDVIMKNGKYVGYYKVGKPYKIYDLYYYPQEYEHYEEIGMASWYGEDFDGKLTANGEIYDLSMMTAAHRTLPMPSIVKVTNLTNKRSVLVRVNDRGPFAKNRIIDLSKRASEMLDYKDRGTIMVKVELDNEKTRELRKKLKILKDD